MRKMKKKQYIKPALLVENFLLSEAIANCGVNINATTVGCLDDAIREEGGDIWPGFTDNTFVSELSCIEEGTEGDIFNGICYHTTSDLIFGS